MEDIDSREKGSEKVNNEVLSLVTDINSDEKPRPWMTNG